jgi:iron(III) transport system substrate-binding protein
LPTSIFDVADPAWRGQVGIAPTNASFQAFVTAMRVLQGDDATRNWLKEIVDNEAKTYPNNVAILDAVDRGEIALGLINHYYWYERADEVGADAVSARLHFLSGADPGALVNASGVGIITGTDRADAAQRFVDYLLSAEAQTYFAEETFEYPLIDGVPTAPGLTPLEKLAGPPIDLSGLDDLSGTFTMLQEVGLT